MAELAALLCTGVYVAKGSLRSCWHLWLALQHTAKPQHSERWSWQIISWGKLFEVPCPHLPQGKTFKR